MNGKPERMGGFPRLTQIHCETATAHRHCSSKLHIKYKLYLAAKQLFLASEDITTYLDKQQTKTQDQNAQAVTSSLPLDTNSSNRGSPQDQRVASWDELQGALTQHSSPSCLSTIYCTIYNTNTFLFFFRNMTLKS